MVSYDYTDHTGQILYSKVRTDLAKGGKTFHFDPEKPPQRVPFLLHTWDQLAHNQIFLCEGEKDALTIHGLGHRATCFDSGTSLPEDLLFYLEPFEVILVEDNDDAGRKRTQEGYKALAGLCERVGVMRFPDLPPKSDVTDWAESLGRNPTREEMRERITWREPEFIIRSARQQFEIDRSSSWLCHQIIPSNDLSIIMGPYGQGKTFVSLDLAYAISQGREWQGHPTIKSKVLYISMEGVKAFERRVHAIIDKHGTSDGFEWMAGTVKFLDETGQISIPNELKYRIVKGNYDLIVFDTLSKMLAGLDQNASQDATAMIVMLEQLRADAKAAVAIIAHPPKAGGKTVKGAGDWDAAVSSLIHVEDHIIEHVKQRDGLKVEDMGFKLNVVDLGFDDAAFEISTCIVEAVPVEEVKTANDDATQHRNERMEDFHTYADGHGINLHSIPVSMRGSDPGSLPTQVKYVKKADFTAFLEERTGKSNNAARNTVNKLVEKGMLKQCGIGRDAYVWAAYKNGA